MEKKKFFSSKKRIVLFIILIIVLVVIVLIAVGIYRVAKVAQTFVGEMVEAQTLEQQDMSDSIYVTGVVESQNVLAVTTELQAKVETLEVSLGDRVEEGQVLCTFDATDVSRQLSDLQNQASRQAAMDQQQRSIAERDVASAQANRDLVVGRAAQDVAEAQARLEEAQADPSVLLPGETIADREASLTQAQRAFEDTQVQANASVQSAIDTLNATNLQSNTSSEANTQIADLQSKLSKTTVTAEQSGIITQLQVERGSMPTAGALMQIADDQNLRVRVPIREVDILKLQPGMSAIITCDALPDQEFRGTVSQVINFAVNNGTTGGEAAYGSTGGSGGGYSAYVDVESKGDLLLGMTVKVEIMIQEGGMQLAVPYDSIMEDENGSYVFLARDTENGVEYRIEKVYVTVGTTNSYYTQITSPELSEGDYIITTPYLVSEGDVVPLTIGGSFVFDEESMGE